MSSDAANTVRASVGDWALAAQIGLLASPTVATALADLLDEIASDSGDDAHRLNEIRAARDALESAISRQGDSNG